MRCIAINLVVFFAIYCLGLHCIVLYCHVWPRYCPRTKQATHGRAALFCNIASPLFLSNIFSQEAHTFIGIFFTKAIFLYGISLLERSIFLFDMEWFFTVDPVLCRFFSEKIHKDEIRSSSEILKYVWYKCALIQLDVEKYKRWVEWEKKELGGQYRMANNPPHTTSPFSPYPLVLKIS